MKPASRKPYVVSASHHVQLLPPPATGTVMAVRILPEPERRSRWWAFVLRLAIGYALIGLAVGAGYLLADWDWSRRLQEAERAAVQEAHRAEAWETYHLEQAQWFEAELDRRDVELWWAQDRVADYRREIAFLQAMLAALRGSGQQEPEGENKGEDY